MMKPNKQEASSGPNQETMSDNKNNEQVVRPKKGGRVTLYPPKKAELLIKALRAGLTHKQACLACGIARQTLTNWCEKYPDFESRVEAAREEARQNALESIKRAGKEDWKALAQWLRLAFPEYRTERATVNVSSHNQTLVLCDEETRQQIIEMRRKLLGNREGNYRNNHEPNDRLIEDAEIIEHKEP
jgi:hypothetical protein